MPIKTKKDAKNEKYTCIPKLHKKAPKINKKNANF